VEIETKKNDQRRTDVRPARLANLHNLWHAAAEVFVDLPQAVDAKGGADGNKNQKCDVEPDRRLANSILPEQPSRDRDGIVIEIALRSLYLPSQPAEAHDCDGQGVAVVFLF
jgi:hypothetical protein